MGWTPPQTHHSPPCLTRFTTQRILDIRHNFGSSPFTAGAHKEECGAVAPRPSLYPLPTVELARIGGTVEMFQCTITAFRASYPPDSSGGGACGGFSEEYALGIVYPLSPLASAAVALSCPYAGTVTVLLHGNKIITISTRRSATLLQESSEDTAL